MAQKATGKIGNKSHKERQRDESGQDTEPVRYLGTSRRQTPTIIKNTQFQLNDITDVGRRSTATALDYERYGTVAYMEGKSGHEAGSRPASVRKSVKFFDFKGLIAPVFTAFNDDETKSLNVRFIDRYAKWLKSKNIHGIVVNGITGEGPTLNLAERKLHAEYWWHAAVDNELMMMLQIGGAPLPDVLEMGHLAEKLGVHCVCCLPEVFYKPRSIDQLVAYCRIVAKTCSSRPFFYYHIPKITEVNLNMPLFCNRAEESMPNFYGLIYSHKDIEMAHRCMGYRRCIFLALSGMQISGHMLGFETFIMAVVNVRPDLCLELYNACREQNLSLAKQKQQELNELIIKKLPDFEWDSSIVNMKYWFNEQMLIPGFGAGFTAGPARSHITTIHD